jgi:hypothetical protein
MPEKGGGEFLNIKYPDLQKSDQVQKSVEKKQRLEGIKTPNNPSERNEVFLDRLENIFNNSNEGTKERNIELFKNSFLYPQVLIDRDNIPDSYFDLQIKIAREEGKGGDLDNIKSAKDIDEKIKRQIGESLYKDQKQSINTWIDYLTSNDSIYPTWFKYYTLKNVVKMGTYDKEKKEFSKRGKNTTGIFPDLNREALAFTYDVLEKHHLKHEKHNNEELNRIVDSANFSKIYAYAIDKVTLASKENKEKTEGEWIKFNQGDDPTVLYESLQGHSTGWCTAGEETARIQLKNGDFYVYYSKDQDNKNTIPRVAIRMDHGQVAEVRGIEKDQNIESNLLDIAQEKYHQLPGGEKFDKKDHDMKLLTLIDNKAKKNEELTKDELKFIYGLNGPIEGFGYKDDSRIKELSNTRDLEKDMPIVFDCNPEQIAHKQKEINQNTKVYVGKLFPGIFNKLPPQIDYIYTSFPEKRIIRDTVTIGGETAQALKQKLWDANIIIDSWAIDILISNKFTTIKTPEKIDLIKLQVSDLGFTTEYLTTTEELYQRANEFGLEPCPAEVGPHYRLKYTDQPLKEYLYICIKKIDKSVFGLAHSDDRLWLGAPWTRRWNLDSKIVFRYRK